MGLVLGAGRRVTTGAPARPKRRLWRVPVALAGTTLALGLAWRHVDTDALAALRGQIQWAWVGVAAALVPVQIALAALRWRHISGRLGHTLTTRRAVSEYALSTLINQVLPGGISGDLLRVWRQRTAAAIDLGGALRAAVVERWSGQAFLGLATAAGMVVGWIAMPEVAELGPLLVPITAIALVLLGLPLLPATTPLLGALAQDARVGVIHAPGPVLILTLALHLSLLGGFAACALALGHPLGMALWVAVPLVLTAMALPLAVAGWGPRELGAMFALPWFGWTPTEAFVLAVLFGLATLVGSLPGALVFLLGGEANGEAGDDHAGERRHDTTRENLAAVTSTPPPSHTPTPRPAPPRRWTPLAALAALCFFINLPMALAGTWIPWQAFTLSGEVLLFVLLARRLPAPWRGPALALAWTPVLIYELVRLLGFYLTGRDPLLYDQVLLLRHLTLLLRDLWGAMGSAVPMIVALVAALIALLVSRVARPVLQGGPSSRLLIGLLGAAAVGPLLPGPWPGRWSTPSFVENMGESWAVYQVVRGGLNQHAYDHHAEVTLTRRPDVELYVIESYGRLLDQEEQLRGPWEDTLAQVQEDLQAEGWAMASAYTEAPVSGGRSWLSDATVLLGLRVGHEAIWQQVQQSLGELPHLPRFAATRGYETVVVRPKDRARPGVGLRNDFDWGHTIFHDEVAYTGPPHGWGVIPDQFSLGRLHDELLPEVASPRLVFFHGVTAHGPWDAVPPIAEDWRSLAEGEHDGTAPKKDFRAAVAIEIQLKRYRTLKRSVQRTLGPMETWGAEYLSAILHCLHVYTDAIGSPPETGDGRIVIIYGDHQPPLVSHGKGFDVPMHVLASDPVLLQRFLDAGFLPGMHPSGEAVMRLEGTHALVVSALAHANGQAVPLRPDGVNLSPTQDTP